MEKAMRKISTSRFPDSNDTVLDAGATDSRPRRIPGATITGWSRSPDIDLATFFAQPASGATVGGAGPAAAAQDDHDGNGTVMLSDGTSVTFVTTGGFASLEVV
jgi:hypothetical protein